MKIIFLTFILFVWGHWRYDIVSIIALSILFVTDIILGGAKSDLIVEPSSIFLGFGHPAVITVADECVFNCTNPPLIFTYIFLCPFGQSASTQA